MKDQELLNLQLIDTARNLSSDAEAVLSLLQRGADIDAKDSRSGNTALLLAAVMGRTEMVQVLAERGANIEAKNDANNTPLLQAAQWGSVETIEVLLAHGADLEARNKQGDTALSLAKNRRNKDVIAILVSALEKKHLLETVAINSAQTPDDQSFNF